jgi:23S rRNA (uracil1939-C5)-methyltransferase
VHVRDGAVGFFRRESNKLLDIERCPIALSEVNAQLTDLRGSRPRDGHYTLRASEGPRVFTQANDGVATAMLDLVDRLLGSAGGTLIDAYCGAGFFSKRLRGRFGKVIGIDWDQQAVAVAREDANENETYVAMDVETELGAQLRSIAPASDRGNSAVIVDPPATGLSKMILESLMEHQPTQLIYVSCNPATLARDLVTLKQSFRIDSITPLDMFPQTAEIECVAHLRIESENYA